MVKKGSFNLISEEEMKKSENSTNWISCLIVPVVVCTMLLLILVNVDFSGDDYENSVKKITVTTTQELASTMLLMEQTKSNALKDEKSAVPTASSAISSSRVTTDPKLNESPSLLSSRISHGDDATPRFLNCQESNKGCTLKCEMSSSDKTELNSRLASNQKYCPTHLELILEASSFSFGKFEKNFLKGSYNLENLTMQNNVLWTIADSAFNNPSLNTLKRLVITDSTIDQMNEATFAGLADLQYFKMFNKQATQTLKAPKFLKALTSLSEISFIQATTPNNKYDPAVWFDGGTFSSLTVVDLSRNSFTDTLTRKSFENLNSVKTLDLTQCGIQKFAVDTFEPIVDTLEYLGLKDNAIKVLSPEVVLGFKGIKLELSNNRWDCDCDNFQLIEAIKNTEIQLVDEPKCSAPPNWEGFLLKDVKICCDDDEENCQEETEITTESTSTAPSDPTSDTEDTSTSIETTTSDTTKAPTTSSTISPPKLLELTCRQPEGDGKRILLEKPIATFKITNNSPTSVIVQFTDLPKDSSLLYFTPDNKTKSKSIPLEYRNTEISNLSQGVSYVFCIVPSALSTLVISPFNCRSHHMPKRRTDDETSVWLTTADMPLFLSLAIIGSIIFLLIGLFGVYFLLRSRPTWIYGSRRIFKISADSKKVILAKSCLNLTAAELSKHLRNEYDSIQAPVNTDYVEYFKDFDRYRIAISEIIFHEESNLPPQQRAPAMPPLNDCGEISQESTSTYHLMSSIKEELEEHEYQSLEEYQSETVHRPK